MTRAYTDIDAMERDIVDAFRTVRNGPDAEDGTPEDIALASIETFAVIALRVLRKTNPSKVRSEARTVEIKARMDGLPVLTTEGEPA